MPGASRGGAEDLSPGWVMTPGWVCADPLALPQAAGVWLTPPGDSHVGGFDPGTDGRRSRNPPRRDGSGLGLVVAG